MSAQSIVKCPNCGTEFNAALAIEQELRISMQKEFQQKTLEQNESLKRKEEEIENTRKQVEKWKADETKIIREKLEEERAAIEQQAEKKANEAFELKMQSLQKENDEKGNRLKELQQKEVEFLQRMNALNEKEESMQLEMEKQIALRTEQIKKDAENIATQKAEIQVRQKEQDIKRKEEEMQIVIDRKTMEVAERVRQEEQMKIAELHKQLEDQKKLADEMRKKSEQVSMQLQGEVQELELENLLRTTFPFDSIEEVGKGIKGADCIQTVFHDGAACGKIIFESKRTKSFTNEWIQKLKEDQRNTKSDIGVIVTEALPKELMHFGMIENIWVCTFSEAKSVVTILRHSLIRISQAVASQENKGDKMQMLYDYLTGNEFRQSIEAIVDAFKTMQEDLDKEKRVISTQWDKRQRQLDKVMQNTVSMYGSVKGIAGKAVQEVKGLEMNPDLFLEE